MKIDVTVTFFFGGGEYKNNVTVTVFEGTGNENDITGTIFDLDSDGCYFLSLNDVALV
jgi:hypothetical protein